jgi:Uma2 family endonuclease
MDIELLKSVKKLQKLTNEELSQKSGVPLGTLNKILSGATKSPGYNTLKAIADALKENSYDLNSTNAEVLHKAIPYDVTHKYTTDDYYALPDDARVELMDGNFYFMEAPSAVHQTIIGELYFVIKSYIKKKEGQCKVYLSPFDVRLDNDNKTMLQPDIMVICDKDKVDRSRCNGAPDFIAEIVSRSSGKLDYIKKLNKYLDAGVREYWIIDPEKKMVTVFEFTRDSTPKYYTFVDKIPFGIFKELVIDFSDIEKEISEIEA